MKKAVLGLFSILLLLPLVAARPASDPFPRTEMEIGIQVSPSTILLNWKTQGDARVTVHTEVPYGLFNGAEIDVWLEDDIQATSIFADARGDLVAKFPYQELVSLLGVGTVTLHVKAVARDGTVYFGSDQVRVINP
jgi:hypothetical protein